MARSRKLEIVLAGDAKGAVQAFGQVERRSDGFAGKMKSVGKVAAVAFAAVGAAAAGAAVGLVKIGSAFDKEYDKIRVGTGATGDALKGLQGDFKAVLTSVPTDFASAGSAIADLNTRLGLTGKPLQDLSAQFLELSRITETDVATNVQTVTRLFGDFGVEAADQGPKLDALFRASQATGIGIDQLSATMTQFGAPLRQLGFGFDESAALLAKFEKEGVNTEAIMGGMKMSLGKMAKAGEEPIETFARLTGEMAAAGSAGEANAIAVEAFGTRAGPDLAAAVREGRFEVGDLLGVIQGGSETIKQAGEDTQDFGEKWTLFKNRVLVALEPIAIRVFDAIGTAMDTLGPKVQELIDKWGPPIKDFIQNVLGSIREWWDNNGPAIIDAVKDFIDTVGDAFEDAKKWIKDNEDTIEQWRVRITGIFTTVGGIITGFIQAVKVAWDTFGTTILDSAKRTFDAILRVIDGVLRVIKGIIDVFIGVFTGDWKRAWEGIKGIVSGAWEAIKGVFSLAVERVRLIVSLAWEAVKRIFGNAFASMKDTVHLGLLRIREIFLGFAEKIVGLAEKAFGWMPGIGPKLREASERIKEFREETNREMDKIKNKEVRITVMRSIQERIQSGGWRGDGPGNIAAAGKAIVRAQAASTNLPVRMSSSYRSPAHNARVGGSPTSYHLDRGNPASDWVGPSWALDEMARRLRAAGPRRELLWRTRGHFDHLHYAHKGEFLSSNSPGWRPGLETDERLRVVQVGETIVPKGATRGNDGGSSGDIIINFYGPTTDDGVRWVVSKIAEAKRKGYVGV